MTQAGSSIKKCAGLSRASTMLAIQHWQLCQLYGLARAAILLALRGVDFPAMGECIPLAPDVLKLILVIRKSSNPDSREVHDGIRTRDRGERSATANPQSDPSILLEDRGFRLHEDPPPAQQSRVGAKRIWDRRKRTLAADRSWHDPQ
jgi:hypothetical protein